MSSDAKIRVLFVCLGNICRSPTAEGVFRALVEKAGLADDFEIDSAGTGSWHVGQAPDDRAQAACLKVGIDISKHRARRISTADFAHFDWIFACDESNYEDLQALAPTRAKAHLALLMPYAGNPEERILPDPYEEGPAAFDATVRRCRKACQGVLSALTAGDE